VTLKDGKVIAEFNVKSDAGFDKVNIGGRIPPIIGRGLTAKVRDSRKIFLERPFRRPVLLARAATALPTSVTAPH